MFNDDDKMVIGVAKSDYLTTSPFQNEDSKAFAFVMRVLFRYLSRCA